VDGVLIKSENWQALNLLLEKYREKVKCIYIDPPFNSKATEILYKNTYKHSSWLSLMGDRLVSSLSLLLSDGVLVCAIDENEQERLGLLLTELLPDRERTCVTVIHNPRGIQGAGFSYTNEFAYFVHRQGLNLGMRFLEDTKAKPLMKTGFESERQTAKNCFYPIYLKTGCVVRVGDVPSDEWHPEQAVRELENGEVEVWPISSTDNKERKWRYARQSIDSVLDQLEVREGRDGRPVIYLGKTKESYRTVWSDPDFNAAEYGSTLLKNIVDIDFSFPKSVWTVFHSLRVSNVNDGDLVLDFFAGSGTTAHAVINLNRHDGGRRRYILVEIGDWFETVMLPRIKKVVFCEKWKDGKPQGGPGISHLLKYQYLEQYEDTLNNLELPRAVEGQKMLELFGDEYLLKYMLDFETQGSTSLLNLDMFKDPFAYKLKVQEGDEIVERPVDLVETFDYLLGIQVKKMKTFQNGERLYRAVLGEKNGKQVAIVWRSVVGLEDNEKALTNDKAYIETTVLPALLGEAKPDRLLVNGACFVKDAEAIEPEFHRLMFAPVGV